MYNLFRELVGSVTISYEDYWSLKSKNIFQRKILQKYFNYDDAQVKIFQQQWLEKIEEIERLKSDCPVNGAEVLLKELKAEYKLYIVTNRQSEKNVLEQVNGFGWTNYFEKIFVTKQQSAKSKIVESVAYSENSYFIGDTGEDIIAAKELKCCSVAVLYSILTKDILMKYSPDYYIHRITDFLEIARKEKVK